MAECFGTGWKAAAPCSLRGESFDYKMAETGHESGRKIAGAIVNPIRHIFEREKASAVDFGAVSPDFPAEIAAIKFNEFVIGLRTGLEFGNTFERFPRTNKQFFLQLTNSSIGVFFT